MAETATRRLAVFGFLIALVVLIADQASKSYVLYGLDFIECPACIPIDLTSFFSLTMVWNRGISYGLLPAGSNGEIWLLIAFSLGMAGILSWWLIRAQSRWLALGLGLVVGGALGNVIDRFIYGAVADFFHFHAFGKSWYVFNVADAAIVMGVVAILIDALFIGRPKTAGEVEGLRDDAR
ncbi:Lipoprotein signal peptidase [Alphaproteobacteria bacterium SO-S41]|nr:Lipoprotein signal peptidase [Alphaproteobacteria bacterium SO-S41]